MDKDEIDINIKPSVIKKHIFIDESGSPDFYGNKKKLLIGNDGFSPVLLLGMIETRDKKELRNKIIDFKSQLLKDQALKKIFSLHKKGWYLHAKEDHPQVRKLFFEFIKQLEFSSHAVIGRKNLYTFHGKHKGKTEEFYFDLVKHLISTKFKHQCEYELILASRSKTDMGFFSDATKKALEIYSKQLKNSVEREYKCFILKSSECPELSVTDYMLWALQRYILKKDIESFDIIKDKFSLIIDLYGFKNDRYFYKKNPFSLDKVHPFVNQEDEKNSA
jgi:hypothetical protein